MIQTWEVHLHSHKKWWVLAAPTHIKEAGVVHLHLLTAKVVGGLPPPLTHKVVGGGHLH